VAIVVASGVRVKRRSVVIKELLGSVAVASPWVSEFDGKPAEAFFQVRIQLLSLRTVSDLAYDGNTDAARVDFQHIHGFVVRAVDLVSKYIYIIRVQKLHLLLVHQLEILFNEKHKRHVYGFVEVFRVVRGPHKLRQGDQESQRVVVISAAVSQVTIRVWGKRSCVLAVVVVRVQVW